MQHFSGIIHLCWSWWRQHISADLHEVLLMQMWFNPLMCVVQHALILLHLDFLGLCMFRGPNVHRERELMETENMCLKDFRLKVSCFCFFKAREQTRLGHTEV